MVEISDHEKQLGDLEERIDRLRALYEQYFMGIERLEPMIPRKDVDRRIQGLRKEQMRNTALRFRFNTLCQRFNTMQQHWGRITREIENGTYKRDVARAAARFGVDEALTAVGRKRAAGLKKVLDAQREVEVQQQEKRRHSDQYEAVSAADLMDDEEDAPTPPPQRRPGDAPARAPATVYDTSKFAAPEADLAALERFGFGKPRAPEAEGAPEPPPAPVEAPPAAAPPPAAAAVAPAESAAPAKKAAGGLRLGGGRPAARTADPEAARLRLLELAEKMGTATPEPAEVAPARPMGPTRKFSPEDVLAASIPPSVPPPAPPPPRSSRKSARPAPDPVIAPTEPGTDSSPRPAPPAGTPPPATSMPARPLGLRPPSATRAPSSADLEPPAAPSPAPPPVAAAPRAEAPAAPADASPTAADRADARRNEVANRAGKREDLAEPRVREIYKEFIEAKRRSNESTASITFDKLSDSLRKQVDKLKKEHTDRKIDFAVVTKDGKTMIKPIIK